MWRFVVVVIVVGGCSYSPPGGNVGDTSDAPGTTGDASIIGDDAPEVVSCTTGDRLCVDATHAGVCDATQTAVADRTCPPGSTCSAGHCAAPTGATSCTAAADCTGGQVCDLFVVNNALVGRCADPLGSNQGSCSPTGDAPTCQTGLCADDSGDGERACLTRCTSSNDCSGGDSCVSVDQPTTIEGVPTAGYKYCTKVD